jgi:hypothetical protein
MKPSTLVSLPIFVLVVVAIFIFISCENGVVTPTLTGTYIISDYSEDWDNTTGGEDPWGGGGGGVPEIIIISTGSSSNEYTCQNYLKQGDIDPVSTFTLTVTNQWTDSEGNLFVEYEYELGILNVYVLVKIHSDNQTLEANLSLFTYPSEINPTIFYVIYNRQ